MKGQMYVIKPTGDERDIEVIDCEKPPGLAALQEAVGGYIEFIPWMNQFVTKDGPKPCVTYCNEEGRIVGLPVNRIANEMSIDPSTQVYPLLGTIVILTGDDEFMADL